MRLSSAQPEIVDNERDHEVGLGIERFGGVGFRLGVVGLSIEATALNPESETAQTQRIS